MLPWILALRCRLLVACLLLASHAHAADLFSFLLGDRVLAFVVADASPLPATVDQEQAAQIGLEWAQKYYRTTNLNLLSIDFQTEPTRFWRVELMAQRTRVYAVVLPNGRAVEPVRRDQL